jgi:thiamine biosynthesis lipoprotein
MNSIKQYLYEITKRFRSDSLKTILIKVWYGTKRIKWVLVLLICLVLFQVYRNRIQLVVSRGEILGKPHEIQYWSKKATNYQADIDSLLADLVQAVDPDKENSVIRLFNRYDCRPFYLEKPFLYHLLDKSKAIYKATNGAFDPTVAPLVKLWRAHRSHSSQPSASEIRALQEYVGLDYVVVNPERVKRLKEGVSLDVQGLLHGYMLDVVAGLLDGYGVKNKLVKVGKQVLAHGKQNKNQNWLVKEDLLLYLGHADSLHIEAVLQDQAMVVKERYQSIADKQSALMIDPETGYPAHNELLAVVVFAKDGISADAYGTAIMVKGIGLAQKLATAQKDVEVLAIYQDSSGQVAYYTSDGLKMEQDPDTQQIRLTHLSTNTK